MESEYAPLSKAALGVLNDVEAACIDGRIFAGQGKTEFISEQALRKVLKSYDQTLTIHGFRSTFRDWCAEMTNYPREVAEAALAHRIKDQTEAAYQRGDLFVKRAKLMEAWSQYCLSGDSEALVVPINKSKLGT